jgi:hypothetical protein
MPKFGTCAAGIWNLHPLLPGPEPGETGKLDCLLLLRQIYLRGHTFKALNGPGIIYARAHQQQDACMICGSWSSSVHASVHDPPARPGDACIPMLLLMRACLRAWLAAWSTPSWSTERWRESQAWRIEFSFRDIGVEQAAELVLRGLPFHADIFIRKFDYPRLA